MESEPALARRRPRKPPEPPAQPVTRQGDLWPLGGRRLLCGDATNAVDVGSLLDGAKPQAIHNTDQNASASAAFVGWSGNSASSY